MKKMNIIILLVFILATTCFGFVAYRYFAEKYLKIGDSSYQTESTVLQTDVYAKFQTYLENSRKLKAMQQSLVIAYGITKWEARYYSYIFYDFSKHYGLPWEIYPAMIRVESNFRTTLKSDKDAKGISQVLESTAAEVAQKIGINYVNGETPWNDLLNLVIGVTYLSDQISTGNGSDDEKIKHGIKCYLGGPDYLRKSVSNQNTNTYLANYSTTVWQEYVKLSYIYKGVYADAKSKSKLDEKIDPEFLIPIEDDSVLTSMAANE
jgi:soluble lytic murein transglycosylase